MKGIGRAWAIAAGALVLAADFPWGDVQNHTHWANVGWIPFVSPPVGSFDILQNLLLGVPLGVVCALGFRRAALCASLFAFAFSLAGEATQLYSHTRFPSATDVTCNVIGAAGTACAVRVLARRHLAEGLS